MSTQTYIVTDTVSKDLENLLRRCEPVATDDPAPAPFPARARAMRDYPTPPAGLVEVLGAAIISWESEAGSGTHSPDAATTFRACAWELRQILGDFPDTTGQSTTKGRTR